jgi:putative endonuclease
MERGGYVYILSNKTRTVLYVGVTSNLRDRITQHRDKIYPTSFTAKYNCSDLLYYRGYHHIEEAIAEEKRIKAGSRNGKLNLIYEMNPLWKDLFDSMDE